MTTPHQHPATRTNTTTTQPELMSGKERWPLLYFAIIGVLILLPIFGNGQPFLLDMPWPERLYLEAYARDGVSPHLLLLFALKIVNLFVPAWLLQKLILLSVLTFAGLGIYYLQKKFNTLSTAYALLGGTLYVLNPFVLDRLAAGQWVILAGYAFLPFFAILLWNACTHSTRRTVAFALGAWALYPVISIQWWYIVTLFLVPAAAFLLLRRARRKRRVNPSYTFVQPLTSHLRGNDGSKPWMRLATLGLIVWILLVALHYSNTVHHISGADFAHFATRPIDILGALGAVVSLQGFWYSSLPIPSSLHIPWLLLCLCFFWLTWYYVPTRLRTRHPLRTIYITWALLCAIILAAGYSNGFTQWITDVFRSIVPGYNGLYDTQKIAGLIAFAYAVAVPVAVQQLLIRYQKQTAVRYAAAASLVVYAISMTLAITTTHAKLRPYQYPSDWQGMDTAFYYTQPKQVLTLPWEGYVRLPFAGNTLSANPARHYFSPPTHTGPGQVTEGSQGTTADKHIRSLRSSPDALTQVRAYGYDYILLLHTQDYKKYQKQLDAAGLEKVQSGQSLTLYRTQPQGIDQSF